MDTRGFPQDSQDPLYSLEVFGACMKFGIFTVDMPCKAKLTALYFCSFRPGLHTTSTMVRPLPPAYRITDTSLLVQSRLGREYFRHCNFNISKLVNTSIQFGSGKMIFHLWPESRRRFLALDPLQVTKISSKLAW